MTPPWVVVHLLAMFASDMSRRFLSTVAIQYAVTIRDDRRSFSPAFVALETHLQFCLRIFGIRGHAFPLLTQFEKQSIFLAEITYRRV